MEEQISNVSDLSSTWSRLPIQELSLIDNVLGRGQKMLLTGPSKSCKTSLAIQMAISVAEGCSWLENKCLQREVLYLNFGSTADTIFSRFYETYAAMEIEPANIHKLTINNLRGDMNIYNERKLIEELSPMILTNRYRLVIIDSIDYFTNVNYSETAIRLNQALDSLIEQTLGLCVVFVHTGKDDNETVLGSLCDCVVKIIPTKSGGKRFRSLIVSNSFKNESDKVIEFDYPIASVAGTYNDGMQAANELKREKANLAFIEAFDKVSHDGEPVPVKSIADHLGITRESVYRKVKNINDFKIYNGLVEKSE